MNERNGLATLFDGITFQTTEKEEKNLFCHSTFGRFVFKKKKYGPAPLDIVSLSDYQSLLSSGH